jgi:superfamily II DNA/RNA helicase
MFTTRVLASPIELYQSNGICLTTKPKPSIEILSSIDFDILSSLKQNLYLQFPEQKLLQYGCGKLQILSKLLSDLKHNKHRCLIFTQMTKMLDILEVFLNSHGYTFLRLDSTINKIQRQILIERFNNDNKIFIFILSTRIGGISVNLTGADTVIFYDSDWNPTIDVQVQNRCQRIGQIKDVHIYRLISQNTIEENIFKKANQKRLLGDLTIDSANFDIDCFKKNKIRELFNQSSTIEDQEQLDSNRLTPTTDDDLTITQFEEVLASVEDEVDRQAIEEFNREVNGEFNEEDLNEDQVEEELNTLDKQVLSFIFLLFKKKMIFLFLASTNRTICFTLC